MCNANKQETNKTQFIWESHRDQISNDEIWMKGEEVHHMQLPKIPNKIHRIDVDWPTSK